LLHGSTLLAAQSRHSKRLNAAPTAYLNAIIPLFDTRSGAVCLPNQCARFQHASGTLWKRYYLEKALSITAFLDWFYRITAGRLCQPPWNGNFSPLNPSRSLRPPC